jgi:hypothetical protein
MKKIFLLLFLLPLFISGQHVKKLNGSFKVSSNLNVDDTLTVGDVTSPTSRFEVKGTQANIDTINNITNGYKSNYFYSNINAFNPSSKSNVYGLFVQMDKSNPMNKAKLHALRTELDIKDGDVKLFKGNSIFTEVKGSVKLSGVGYSLSSKLTLNTEDTIKSSVSHISPFYNYLYLYGNGKKIFNGTSTVSCIGNELHVDTNSYIDTLYGVNIDIMNAGSDKIKKFYGYNISGTINATKSYGIYENLTGNVSNYFNAPTYFNSNVNVKDTLTVGDVTEFSNFMNAVVDRSAYDTIVGYINLAKKSDKAEFITGGGADDSKGYFIEPTIIKVTDPHFVTMEEEIFGPVITIYVYDDDKYEETLKVCDETSPYALTGAIFAQDREQLLVGYNALRYAAGNFYLNDKPTGAVVNQQPFGGARGSGTNDKAGSYLNLVRWTNTRTIKETLVSPTDYRYPFLEKE